MEQNYTTIELISLMKRAKQGDKDAFAAVYKAFYLPVFRYLHKRAGNLHDAEDLAQRVFMRLYTSRTEFADQNRSPLNYLFTTSHHALADFWREKKRDFAAPLEDEHEFMAISHDAENILSQIEAQQLLQVVSAEEKTILTLRIVEGYSSRDVAMKVNKSEAAVRQIQCRALQKIREHINSRLGCLRTGSSPQVSP